MNNDPVNRTKKICEKNQNSTDINKLDRDINRILAAFSPSDGFCCEKSPCASKIWRLLKNWGHYGQTLNSLVKAAAENLLDNNLRDQYKAISKKINGVAFDPLLDEKALFGTLQSINIQKMIYQPYINSGISTIELFEKAFKVIDNEGEWNRILDGLSKSNLGLTGLAGTGLYLLDELSLWHSRNVNLKKSAITAR